jgi:hypothetical protein
VIAGVALLVAAALIVGIFIGVAYVVRIVMGKVRRSR